MSYKSDATQTLTVGPLGSGANYLTDGTNDEVQINLAITAAASSSSKSVIKLLPGTYSIAAPISMLSNLTLTADTPGSVKLVKVASGFSGSGGIIIIRGALANPTGRILLSQNRLARYNISADQRMNYLHYAANAESSLIQEDHELFLMSNEVFEPGDTNYRAKGEFIKIAQVFDSDGYLIVNGMVRDDYTLAYNARMFRLSLMSNVTISNLEITTNAPPRNTGNVYESTTYGIQASWTDNLLIDRCIIHNLNAAAITVSNSLRTEITSNQFHDGIDYPSTWLGYGVVCSGCEHLVMTNNVASRIRHLFTTGGSASVDGYSCGISRNIVVSNNAAYNCVDTALDTHGTGDNILFSGNNIENCTGSAIHNRARNSRVINNTISWCGAGITVGSATIGAASGTASGTVVSGNVIKHIHVNTHPATSTSQLALGSGSAIRLSGAKNVSVSNNIIQACDLGGIYLQNNNSNCVINNNIIMDCNQSADTNSSSAAIILQSSISSFYASITSQNGDRVTLQYGGTSIQTYHIGGYVEILGAANPANNGTFPITNTLGINVLEYKNANAIFPDANSGNIHFVIQNNTDNLIINNIARNTPYTREDPNSDGYIRWIIYNDVSSNNATNDGNIRNIYKNNSGFNLASGGGIIKNMNDRSFEAGNATSESTSIKHGLTTADDSLFSAPPSAGALYFDSSANVLWIRDTAPNTWINANSMSLSNQWGASVGSPTINQTTTSTAAGYNITLQGQSTTLASSVGGNVVLRTGASTTIPSNRQISFVDGYDGTARTAIGFQINSYGATTMSIQPTVSSFSIQYNSTAVSNGGSTSLGAQSVVADGYNGGTTTISAGGQNTVGGASTGNGGALAINAGNTNATATGSGGNVNINAGNTAAASGSAGSVNIASGAASATGAFGAINLKSGSNNFIAFTGATVSNGPNPAGSVDMNWASSITAPRIVHAGASTVAGAPFVIRAQSTSLAGANGGDLILQSGSRGAGTSLDGYVFLRIGASDKFILGHSNELAADFITYQSIPLVQWSKGTVNPVLTQDTTPSASSNLTIKAQSTSGAGLGGNLKLRAGGGGSGGGTIQMLDPITGDNVIQFTAAASGISRISFVSTVTSVSLQHTSTAASNGANWSVNAQSSTMSGGTGGDLTLRGGVNSSGTNGNVIIGAASNSFINFIGKTDFAQSSVFHDVITINGTATFATGDISLGASSNIVYSPARDSVIRKLPIKPLGISGPAGGTVPGTIAKNSEYLAQYYPAYQADPYRWYTAPASSGFNIAQSSASKSHYGIIISMNEYLINGATLMSAQASLKGSPGHGTIPPASDTFAPPCIGIFRRDIGGVVTYLMSATPHVIFDASADETAYQLPHLITFTPDQNNVIDLSGYNYFMIIFDEGGPPASSGFKGVQWFGIDLTFSNITGEYYSRNYT